MKVLISHIQEEQPLAEVLASCLEAEFGGQFKSELDHDLDSLDTGEAWLAAIEPLYAQNTLLIVLASPHSISRPWSGFAAGGLNGNRTPLLLICHSGLVREQLPLSLSECDALEVDEEGFEGRFIAMVSNKTHLERAPTIDEMAFRDRLRKALRQVEQHELAAQHLHLPGELLDEQCLEILTTLAKSAGGSLSAGQLVERLKLPQQVLDGHLHTLMQRELVSDMVYRDGPHAYTLSQRGREFMQEVSLL